MIHCGRRRVSFTRCRMIGFVIVYIPTEHRNYEILILLQIYTNYQKSKLMLTCMQLKTFGRQVHRMVTKKSRILRIWWMEGRRGHFKFKTFSRRFAYRWHFTMQSMRALPKLSNYRRRSQKSFSIICGHDGHVYKTNILAFINSF